MASLFDCQWRVWGKELPLAVPVLATWAADVPLSLAEALRLFCRALVAEMYPSAAAARADKSYAGAFLKWDGASIP